MGEVVNLRRERQRAVRERDAAKAAENRAVRGMTKAERAAEAERRALAERRLDGHRRDCEPEPE